MKLYLALFITLIYALSISAQQTFSCDPSRPLNKEEIAQALARYGSCKTSIHPLESSASCEPDLSFTPDECFYARLGYIYAKAADLGLTVEPSCVDALVNEVAQVFGDNSAVYAYVLNKQAVVAYYQDDDYLALDLYAEALSIRRSLQINNPNPDLDHGIMRILVNLSNSFDWLDSTEIQIETHKEINQLLQQSEIRSTHPKLYTDYLTSRGSLAQQILDLDNAVLAYQTLIDYQRERGDGQCSEFITTNSITARNQLILIYGGELERFAEANSLAHENKQLLDQLSAKNGKEQSYDKFYREYYTNYAISLTAQKRYREAVITSSLALSLAQTTQTEDIEALVLNNLSYLYLQQQDIDQANKYATAGLELAKTFEIEALYDNFYDNLSDVALHRKQFDLALRYNTQAIMRSISSPAQQPAEVNFSIGGGTYFNDPDLLMILLRSRAHIQALRSELSSALHTYRQAADLIERMRLSFRSDISKGLLAKRAKPLFAGAIETCWQLYQQTEDPTYAEQALLFSERSRSLILYDAVSHQQATTLLDPEVAERDKTLQLLLTFAEKQAADGLVEVGEVLALRQQLADFRDSLQASFPNYYNWVTQPITKDVNALRQQLQTGKCYVEFFSAATGVYAFVIDRAQNVHFQKLVDDQATINEIIQTCLKQVKTAQNSFLQPAFQLYQQLYSPLVSYIDSDELVIIPDGQLAYLSFDLLPTRLPENLDHFSLLGFEDYLLNEHLISYHYSLALNARSTKAAPNSLYNFLGIAPDFSDALILENKRFGELHQTKALIQNLEQMYGGPTEAWYGNTKTRLMQSPHQYRIIQFATHALANDKAGDRSFILLGNDSANILTAKEIYGLRMPNTELVILSACEGADGQLAEGEGIISLGRSFSYAGAQAVVPTLWTVDEAATIYITQRFHTYLLEGQPKHSALRNARLEYLTDYLREAYDNGRHPEFDALAHPFYWAAFVPFGNMEAMEGLQSDTNLPTQFWPILLVVVLVFGGIFIFFSKKS